MRAKLMALQVSTKLSLLNSRVTRMRAERERGDSLDHLNELRHTLSARQVERQVFIDEWRRSLLEELLRAGKRRRYCRKPGEGGADERSFRC